MSGTSGLSDDLKKAMTGYIDACKLVSAGQVSADDCAFNAAREDVEGSMMGWHGLSEQGWTDKERVLCMQMLEEDARANPNVCERLDPFFVVADARLFAAATHMFGKQYDMLGAMLQNADGVENLESIMILCAKLNIQPFRQQDVRRHIDPVVFFEIFDEADQPLVRAWYETMCIEKDKDKGSSVTGQSTA